MIPSDLDVRVCVDALMRLREVDRARPEARDAAVGEAATTIEKLLGQLTAKGMPAREGRAIAQALANLADVWREARERQAGGEEAAGGAITTRILGAAGGELSFVPTALAEGAQVGPVTQEAWGAALALGVRGPLRAADATRLMLELVPAEPTQKVADAMLGPGRRPDGRRRLLVWLPWALATCAIVLTVGLAMQLHADAAELAAAWPAAAGP